MNRLIPVFAFGLVLLLSTGCNSYKEKVIGTWATDLPMNPTFTFSADGTGSISFDVFGKAASKPLNWRIKSNNLIFNMDGKDSGFLIRSADENKLVVYDPAYEGGKKDFTFTRK